MRNIITLGRVGEILNNCINFTLYGILIIL